jgi:hypothetical protein
MIQFQEVVYAYKNLHFQHTTEHRSNYDGKRGELQRAARPITEYHPSSEPLDGTTTYRLGFDHKKGNTTIYRK